VVVNLFIDVVVGLAVKVVIAGQEKRALRKHAPGLAAR